MTIKWADLKRLLKSDGNDYSNYGAIMWPVQYPNMEDQHYQPVDPHVTIIFLGDITAPNLGYTKQDVIEAIESTFWNTYLMLNVDGLDWFGPDKDVPVLKVSNVYLEKYWNELKSILLQRNIPFDQTYTEYKPHVTITADAARDRVFPKMLLTTPVELWWGGDHIKIG